MHLPSNDCVLCDQDVEETLQHLFLQCEFAKQCWELINTDIPSTVDFPDVMAYLKNALDSHFFMAATIHLCWAI